MGPELKLPKFRLWATGSRFLHVTPLYWVIVAFAGLAWKSCRCTINSMTGSSVVEVVVEVDVVVVVVVEVEVVVFSARNGRLDSSTQPADNTTATSRISQFMFKTFA